jgi:hypothetical protein
MLDIGRIESSLVACGRFGRRGYSCILLRGGLSLVYDVELVVLSLVEWWMMLRALAVTVALGQLAGLCLRLWLRRRRPGPV